MNFQNGVVDESEVQSTVAAEVAECTEEFNIEGSLRYD